MRGVYYSACSLCYKTIGVCTKKCLLMRDCSLFRRLLLPESTVVENTSALECDKFQTICKYIKNRPSANTDSIGKGSSILPLKQTNIKNRTT